jgi:hypothetical protein
MCKFLHGFDKTRECVNYLLSHVLQVTLSSTFGIVQYFVKTCNILNSAVSKPLFGITVPFMTSFINREKHIPREEPFLLPVRIYVYVCVCVCVWGGGGLTGICNQHDHMLAIFRLR